MIPFPHSLLRATQYCIQLLHWLVVSHICFHPYLGRCSKLTNIFQMGWNHQSVQHTNQPLWYVLLFRKMFPSFLCWKSFYQTPVSRKQTQRTETDKKKGRTLENEGLGSPKKIHPSATSHDWLVASNIFWCSSLFGKKISNLTHHFFSDFAGGKKTPSTLVFFVQKTLGFSPNVFGWGLDLTLLGARKTQSAAAIQDAVQSCVISEESKHRFVPWKAPFFTPVRFGVFFGRRVWAGVRCRGLGVEGWLDAIQYLERCWLGLAVNF